MAHYAGHDNHFYGHSKILKPEHLDWQEYALLLLSSMQVKTAEHYRNKIAIYLHWYQKKGIEVPQTQQGDIGAKDVPSWRRISKVLLDDDYWCRALSFSPQKIEDCQRYNERIKGKRRNGGYYATTINAGFNAISRQLAGSDRMKAINEIRMAIHQVSPFQGKA